MKLDIPESLVTVVHVCARAHVRCWYVGYCDSRLVGGKLDIPGVSRYYGTMDIACT